MISLLKGSRRLTCESAKHATLVFATLMVFAFPVSLIGRLMEAATYKQMLDRAELVVIAKPLFSRDTTERNTLLEQLHVIGVNTEFETRAVLKGDQSVKGFILHHYRLDDRANRTPIIDGPVLASFDPKQSNAYLLFLIKEADGRYAPASGQVDPGAFSVIKLGTAP